MVKYGMDWVVMRFIRMMRNYEDIIVCFDDGGVFFDEDINVDDF